MNTAGIRLLLWGSVFGVMVCSALPARAQESSGIARENIGQEDYLVARVLDVRTEEVHDDADASPATEEHIRVRFLGGAEAGNEVTITRGAFILTDDQRVEAGDTIVVVRAEGIRGIEYFVGGKYRLRGLMGAGVIFLVFVLLFGRRKGIRSLIGLLVSIMILVRFLLPRILHGADPLSSSILAAAMIAVLSLYLAHGVSRRTTIALISTFLVLGIAGGLAVLMVSVARLYGGGTEEAFSLQLGALGMRVNLRGLLLGGMIIGILGVLDDVTTAQVAAVEELHHANPRLSFAELYRRGLSIGREHIISLVNTLALAYVGVSFPLLLLFAVNTDVPLWVQLNSELIAEEIGRTLVGSVALMTAVPIATALAARSVAPRTSSDSSPAARVY